jgi:hypothetical protein
MFAIWTSLRAARLFLSSADPDVAYWRPRAGCYVVRTAQVSWVTVFPRWSRPGGSYVCSMFARMSSSNPVSAGPKRYQEAQCR